MRDGGKTKRRENTKTLRKIQKWKEIDTLESWWKQWTMEKTIGSKEREAVEDFSYEPGAIGNGSNRYSALAQGQSRRCSGEERRKE